MSLISSLSQTSQSSGSSTKVTAQNDGPVQKSASQADQNEQVANNDFESLMKKEQPQKDQVSEKQPSESSPQDESLADKTATNDKKASTDAELKAELKKDTQHEDNSEEQISEENQQLAELTELVEAQANWQAENSSGTQQLSAQTPVSETIPTTTQPADETLSEQAQNALQQSTQDAASKGESAQNAQAVVDKQLAQNNSTVSNSLLAQKASQEAESPEQFKQDSLTQHIDPEEALLSKVKTDDQGTKTSLDIHQLVARLNTSQASQPVDTTTPTYSQVAAAQNTQVTAATQGNTQASVTQARPENQPSLSMFSDPEWPEDLGQRLFRLSSGENGIKEVSLRLDPPSLGTLDIKLKIDDNSLSVQFQSASPQVRELLHNQADRLRASLNDANMNLVDVDVSSGQDSGNHHSHGQADTSLQDTAIAMSTHNSETEGNSPDQDSQGKNSPVSSTLHSDNYHSSNLYLSTYA